MNKFPKWRYFVIIAVLMLGILYALPNLYPAQPAIQIAYTDSSKSADQSLLDTIRDELANNDITAAEINLKNNNIVAQFSSLEDQLVAKTAIQKALLDSVIVALKLEPTTPNWLASLGGKPLKLGLDLSGGVHFLLEVDIKTLLSERLDGLLNSYRKKFRIESINYVSSSKLEDQVIFKFKSSNDYENALDILLTDTITPTGPQFDLIEQRNIYTIKISFSDTAVRELRDYAVGQNLMTLRNRVNELGVSEPVVQRQGANRIVV